MDSVNTSNAVFSEPFPKEMPRLLSARVCYFDSQWALHFHPASCHELLHILDGKMTLRFDDGRVFDAVEGDTLVVPRGTRHRDVFNLASDLKLLHINFSWPSADEWVQRLDNAKINRIKETVRSELRWNFEHMRSNIAADSFSGFIVRIQLMYALTLLFRELCFPVVHAEPGDAHLVLVEAARRYVERNFSQPITLDLIARQLQVSNAHLSRVVRQEYNFSLFEYLLEIRIREAEKLLRDGMQTIQEIAVATGFANGNYFAKVFRRKTGCSPSEYRKKESNIRGITAENDREKD